MLHLLQVLIYFILIKLCLGNLRENLIGKCELAARFTTIDTDKLWSVYGFLFAICKRSCVFTPYARWNNYDILRCPNLSGHPCPVRFNIRQSFLPRVAEGGVPSRDAKSTHASPALRNKCRTLLCSCFYCPCFVSLVSTTPSSVSFYSLFLLILSRPIFDAYCVRDRLPPPASNWCSQVELHASSRPFGELLETATVERLSGRVHLLKVECV